MSLGLRVGAAVVVAIGLSACGPGGDDDVASTTGLTAATTDGPTTGATSSVSGVTSAATSAADTTSTSTSAGVEDSVTGVPVVFDLGTLPDAPGGSTGYGGIPETCAQAENTQSTVGCSFRGNRMTNFQVYDASIVVGNVSETEMTSVQLYFISNGVEVAQGAPVDVGPLQSHEFVLNQPANPPGGSVSTISSAGTYRVQSTFPIVAYQHSPIGAVASNDSSMLIPDHALGQFYIVASWPTTIGNLLSAFNVIAIDDNTTVQWRPRQATTAGGAVPAVAAFALGSSTIDSGELLQVVASTDISGTIIEVDKPAWVVGTNPCANVPAGVTFCDHIEELLIPVEYWGTEYVGAHAPTRGSEDYWWRVYSGADNVTITTTPAQPGTPVVLDRGEFFEFTTTESVIFTGDGGFMPVQYLEGQDGGAGTGDPAAYQMVPSQQFIPRYVFVTGTGYSENYVQVIRPQGGAEVFVDGVLVTDYYAIGNYQVSDWPVAEGAHSADSEDPFGIIQVGYTGVTSYAYPGGLALGFINPNPRG
jgi:hypothetical protein